MINPRSKIVKESGLAPTELEEEVAKALLDIEAAPSGEMKNELRELAITHAREVEVGKTGKAVAIFFPLKLFPTVRKIQGRLIRELEKKFSKRHVVLLAKRRILKFDCAKRGIKVRPRSKTMAYVHNAMLEDLVGPTEIVGKRLRISVDGHKLHKIFLDPKDKDKENIESKTATFAAVYRQFTMKDAVFTFPEN